MKGIQCDVLVVGSGPGGAMTAALLAEAGRDVMLAEEGGDYNLDSAGSYTLTEMDQKYRNGGLTSTLGRTLITYIEGRCLGGASEINAGLYHRPLASTLRDWQLTSQLDDFEAADLWPHFEAVEREVGVASRPDGAGPASRKLAEGADKLGWRHREIARFWRYGAQGERRQSMTETLIPRAVAAGCRLLPWTRIQRVHLRGEVAHSVSGQGPDGPVEIRFRDLFVCGGAVQTPLLLRRSGIVQNVGDSLRLHPMIRLAARFPEPCNDPSWGVPVQQVEEFKPELTLGCSHSSLPHVALWLSGDVPGGRDALLRQDLSRIAIFYVAAVAQGRGRVRALPLLDEPLVRFSLTDQDLSLLGEGLYRLGQLVLAAGAEVIFSPLRGGGTLADAASLRALREVRHGSAQVTTIHLFSSCPMGEDRGRCAVDSYGKLHNYKNIWLNDASILPHSPGVNPQGTILAIARRNALAWLS